MNRRRQGEYDHISDILSGIVKTIRRESATDLTRIREEWERIVDPAIAAYARPEAIKKDILLVRVASPAVTHRLRFMSPAIIEQINSRMGEDFIVEIRYTVGSV